MVFLSEAESSCQLQGEGLETSRNMWYVLILICGQRLYKGPSRDR